MKGILFGNVTIRINNEVIYELDILTRNDIREKKVGDYFLELGEKFFRNNLEIWLNN